MTTDAAMTGGEGERTSLSLSHRLRGGWRLLRDAAAAWQRDNAMRLSAAVAMYTVLSIAPLLIITIKVLSLVLDEAAASGQVEQQLQQTLGPVGAKAVAEMITASSRPSAGLVATGISVVLLLVSASGFFSEIRVSLNYLWGVEKKEGGGLWKTVRERLLSVGMVFVIGFLLLVSQVLTTFLTAVSGYLGGGLGWLSIVADLVISTTCIAALFALLFRTLPNASLGWRESLVGAGVTAVLFKLGQYVQALYFAHASTESAYGAAGSFVVLLLWVYYSCWILFYGAELIQVYVKSRGERVAPSEDAVRKPAA
jgi:membrane protein